jgi:hypothetical protein
LGLSFYESRYEQQEFVLWVSAAILCLEVFTETNFFRKKGALRGAFLFPA